MGSRGRTWRFLANFGAAKVAIYLAPLGIAAMAPPAVYGAFEAGLAISLIIATVLIAAPLHAITHQVTLHRDRYVLDQAAVLVACCSLVGCVGALLAARFGPSDTILLALAILGVTGLQITASFLVRALGHREILAWIDGGGVLCGLAVAAGLAAVFGQPSAETLQSGLFILSLLILLCGATALLIFRRPGLGGRLIAAAKWGFPMLALALLGTWAAVFGRVLVEIAAPEDLPAFALAFRIVGLAVGVPQLLLTSMWPQLYRAKTAMRTAGSPSSFLPQRPLPEVSARSVRAF